MGLLQKIHYRPNTVKRMAPPEQLRFLKRLTRLLELGYSLIEALDNLEMDKTFRSTVVNIKHSLKAGKSLDETLKKARFPPLVTAFIYFARDSGNLFESIRKGTQVYEQRLAYQKTLQATSRYPAILLCVFLFLLYFIKQFLLPSFADMFHNGGESGPGNYAIFMIDFLGYGIIALTSFLVMLFLMHRLMRRHMHIGRQLEIIRSIPLYRNYVQTQTTFNFATHVSSLLANGLPIKSVFHIMSNQNQLPVLAYYSHLMIGELTKGVQPSDVLSKLFFIDNNLAALFQKHVDADTLAKDLGVYAEFLTEDIQRKITKTIGMIQPVMFIILACFIILTYVTLMTPMLDLIETI